MVSNTNFTYTKVNIVDPMFKTTFGTMEIPTGWRYTPNIIWNFPNKNIVIYIMAESPDKTESFTILPFAFGLHYVSADTEYFSQIQNGKSTFREDRPDNNLIDRLYLIHLLP